MLSMAVSSRFAMASMRPAQKARDNDRPPDARARGESGFNEARAKSTG